MVRQLVSIALTVDQHDDGRFYWILIESFDHSMVFEPLMESVDGYGTYIEALDAGYATLKRMPEDLTVGPQDETDETDGLDDPSDT